ncbi:hypothetical protein SCYAM73S_06716 [Streptomyces cyaneofuscatus]
MTPPSRTRRESTYAPRPTYSWSVVYRHRSWTFLPRQADRSASSRCHTRPDQPETQPSG